jgi:hypothetical protein
MSQINFLIGRGELLTHEIQGPQRKPDKAEVYTLQLVASLAHSYPTGFPCIVGRRLATPLDSKQLF